MASPQVLAAANSNRTEADVRTLRQIAADLIAAKDAYIAAFDATCDKTLSPEARIDAVLAHEAAKKRLGAASYALHLAQEAVA